MQQSISMPPDLRARIDRVRHQLAVGASAPSISSLGRVLIERALADVERELATRREGR